MSIRKDTTEGKQNNKKVSFIFSLRMKIMVLARKDWKTWLSA